jgi:hypothetical protein
MTEEVKVVETTPEVKEEVKAPEYTALEQRAMEQGWRPKDEFNGDEETFVDAKEFLGRQPLFDKIETSQKEVKQLRKALENFKNHYTKVKETEYNRALAALKSERKSALENGDGDRFELIDAEIKNVEQQVQEVKQAHEAPLVQDTPQEPIEFVHWKNRNGWYDKMQYMRVYADELGTTLHQQGVKPAEVLKQVEVAVRKKFPDEFVNPRKASAPAVEEGRGSSTASRGNSFKDKLPADARSIMNSLVRSGTMTEEEYIADFKKINNIK